MNPWDKIIETDVLIIGAGGAALMAAIKADEEDVQVTIVTKDKLPSGSTSIAMGAIQAACTSQDSPEIHFKDTIKGGCEINNQKLVKIMTHEVLDRIKELEKFGTKFIKKSGEYLVYPVSGCTYPRLILTENPYEGGFIKGLVNEVKRRNIDVIDKTMITNLIYYNGKVIGAMGLNLEDKSFIVFKAKSTILATGGAGQLYPATTNPQSSTGDGIAMALRIGAELIDMEFIQFRACIIYPEELKGETLPLDGLVYIGGRFYNAYCERYMKKYFPDKAENVTRDLIAIYAYKEIKAGRGTIHGGVYNDLSGVPENELKRFKRFLKKCEEIGLDPRWQPIEWKPGAHYLIGGIRINEKCETNIEGLYACGEVTGGIHGANRLAGNALADIIVFGARAGKYAAQKAKTMKTITIEDKEYIVREKRRIHNVIEKRSGKITPLNLMRKIQELMDNYVGVVRTENELKKALNEIENLKLNIIPQMYIPNMNSINNIKLALEIYNLIDVAKIITIAALTRTESRGSHYREDYPKRNENWLRNIVIKQINNKLEIKTINIIKI